MLHGRHDRKIEAYAIRTQSAKQLSLVVPAFAGTTKESCFADRVLIA